MECGRRDGADGQKVVTEGAIRSWLDVTATIEGLSPRVIASGYALIAGTEKAFAWLEHGYRERRPRSSS